MSEEEKKFKFPKSASDMLKHLKDSFKDAQKARPDVPKEELLFPIMGGDPDGAQSIDELNASGEAMTFLCVRCDDGTSVIRGSTKEECDKCHADVWMSPGTMSTYMQMKKRIILCMQCMLEENKTKEAK